ncbi:MAG: NUDIX domain-containing protein [Candidatus Portnoybacteria bacterium]
MEISQKGKRHFTAGNFVSHAEFVDPPIYGEIVRNNVVRGCVDCLVSNENGRILLGKRVIDPWPDWYTFGGRMVPGESPEEACARTIKRDLGLEVSPDRFAFIDVLSNAFDRRQEPPQENGCHDLNLFHLIIVDEKEATLIKMEKAEYGDINWFWPKEILLGEIIFHPALKRIIHMSLQQDLFP